MNNDEPVSELAERFPDQPSDSDETDQTSERDQASGGSQSAQSSASIKDEQTHVAFYLPPEQAEAYHDFYEKLDARSKLADEGELKKNRDFNQGVIEFVLEHREEVREHLGLDDLD